jgi:DNA polymerase-1
MAKTLYLIDGHYQIYRAFYGLPDRLTSPTGEPTGAVHVFCMMLAGLIRQRKPDHLAMAMDVSDETVFRRDIDPDYKAHRDPAPEALHVQKSRILSIVSAVGIPILQVPGFEADDVMATLARRLGTDGLRVYLVSRDKDLEQLLTEHVHLFDPVKGIEISPAKLLELKGYPPEHALEIQTLVGDSTDNIRGVPGVGTKTALKLIQQFGSADEVVRHADELTPRMAERVKAFADQLPRTRQLVTLRDDVPIELPLESCGLERLNFAAARPTFDELGFTTVKDTFAELARSVGRSDASPLDTDPVLADGAVAGHRGRYELIDTPDKLDALSRSLAAQPAFAVDTETTALQPMRADLVGLSFCFRSGEAYYVPVRAAVGNVLSWNAVLANLGPVLADPKIKKVGHNLKYDLLVLRRAGATVAGVAFDTMIASFLLDPLRRGHSLDALAKSMFDHDMIPITDLIGRGRNQLRMDEADIAHVCEYAAEDADFTWRLYEAFDPRMTGSHVERLFRETEMPLVEVLVQMELNGIALDAGLLATIGDEIEQRLHLLSGDIHNAAGRPFNIDSPKQLGEVLFDELGFTAVKKTKTGRSTDAETLQTLATQVDHPLPGLVLEYRELSKLKGTYVDTLPRMINRETGRIHATFNQIGAVTGRLSSNDPNLQNIPVRTPIGRRIREAFVAAGAESVLVTADYSQIELRLLAHFCRDEALMEAFRSGEDIHRSVAAQVNAVPLNEVTPEQRSAAKAVNFGIIYGQTPFGLSRSLGIPVQEAKAFIDRYFERYPGIRGFIDQCIRDAREKGYAETILGRRRPIPELESRNRGQNSLGERLAVNTVVQGSAADLIKQAMVDLHREIVAGRLPARMLIQVHDELVFEARRADVGVVTELVRRGMEHPLELLVPLVIDVHSAANWAESK